MKLSFTFLLITLCLFVYSQKIINLVFVGENGITQNIKEANSFIVIKKLL